MIESKTLKTFLKRIPGVSLTHYNLQRVDLLRKIFQEHMYLAFKRCFSLYSIDEKKLLNLKNSRLGQKCFIVGNGPSVLPEDLNFIHKSGLTSFAANHVAKIFKETVWRPTFVTMMDYALSKAEIESYLNAFIESNVSKVFLNHLYKKDVSYEMHDLANVVYFRRAQNTYWSDYTRGFSENPELFIGELGSVTHANIQLACFMGFKEIYLYGIDNSYQRYYGTDRYFHIDASVSDYCYQQNHVSTSDEIKFKSGYRAWKEGGFNNIRRMTIGYEICQRYARDNGIKIINTTNGGQLEIFERMSIKALQ